MSDPAYPLTCSQRHRSGTLKSSDHTGEDPVQLGGTLIVVGVVELDTPAALTLSGRSISELRHGSIGDAGPADAGPATADEEQKRGDDCAFGCSGAGA